MTFIRSEDSDRKETQRSSQIASCRFAARVFRAVLSLQQVDRSAFTACSLDEERLMSKLPSPWPLRPSSWFRSIRLVRSKAIYRILYPNPAGAFSHCRTPNLEATPAQGREDFAGRFFSPQNRTPVLVYVRPQPARTEWRRLLSPFPHACC